MFILIVVAMRFVIAFIKPILCLCFMFIFTPILKSLHRLKINERIEYKLLSLTYKALTIALPSCVHSLISVQPLVLLAPYLLSVVTRSRPPTSSLRIFNRSFRYASPHLWNQLSVSFRQPCTKHPADDVTLCNSPPTCSPLLPSTLHCFIPGSKLTFSKSFPP